MNHDHAELRRIAAAILGRATLADPTTPQKDIAVLNSWVEILATAPHRITVEGALAAVVQHYATQTRRIMPADVIRMTVPSKPDSDGEVLKLMPPSRFDEGAAQRAHQRNLPHIQAIRDQLAAKRLKRDEDAEQAEADAANEDSPDAGEVTA